VTPFPFQSAVTPSVATILRNELQIDALPIAALHPGTAFVPCNWFNIVNLANGAVHDLLNAPAIPPHTNNFVVSFTAIHAPAGSIASYRPFSSLFLPTVPLTSVPDPFVVVVVALETTTILTSAPSSSPVGFPRPIHPRFSTNGGSDDGSEVETPIPCVISIRSRSDPDPIARPTSASGAFLDRRNAAFQKISSLNHFLIYNPSNGL
jgi:hypothetical protein